MSCRLLFHVSEKKNQDFSKILVVLGLQNSGGGDGGGGWYPYKANGKINRVKTTTCQCYRPFKLEFAKILSRGEFIFGRRGRGARSARRPRPNS